MSQQKADSAKVSEFDWMRPDPTVEDPLAEDWRRGLIPTWAIDYRDSIWNYLHGFRHADGDPFGSHAGWGRPVGPDGVRLRIDLTSGWSVESGDDGDSYRVVQTDDNEAVSAFALTGDLAMEMPLRRGSGGTAVAEVKVRRRDGQPLAARDLARLGLGEAYEALARAMGHPAVVEYLGERWGAVDVPRPGRRGRPPLYYALAARDYVRALETSPRSPVKALVNEARARGEHVTANEVSARLRRARERGLLTGATKGRAGGELTDKAKQLLGGAGLLGDQGVTHGER